MTYKLHERIDNPSVIDIDYIDNEIKSGKHVIVQFSKELYTDRHLSILNELSKKYNSDFGIRFYGHYSGSFDCKTLLKIPNVKCLYIDCLMKADNVKCIYDLNELEKISVGIYELKETEILSGDNLKNISELIITETNTRALNLSYLEDYKNLKLLSVGQHTKNIEAIGEIRTLEFLVLSSIKNTPIEFVNKLKRLKTLHIVLGGRQDIKEIEENEIEDLEIVFVRGFKDLSNISNFKKLKSFQLQDNAQLSNIHFDEELSKLQSLWIINCKSLETLTGLENLSSLRHLRISKTKIDIDKFLGGKLPGTLEIFGFYTDKKIDKEIRKTLDKRGYKEWDK